MQAAILRVKLLHLDSWNSRRRLLAERYQRGLVDCGLVLPQVPDWAEPAWHLYVVQHPKRDILQKQLGEAGVGTLIHYPIPPHLQQAYASEKWSKGDFPLAEHMAAQLLSLPMGPHLQISQINSVIEIVDAIRV